MTGPVDRYLDELFDRLAGTGAAGRRALAEAEDHLRAATADGVRQGMSEAEAERAAVARFGPAARVGTELRVAHFNLPALARRAFSGVWLVGALGALTVGVSGLVAELFGVAFGARFVAGDSPDVTYTPARCADYFEYSPHAKTCAEAAALHHFGEVAQYRELLGVLGLLALLAYFGFRRWSPMRDAAWAPPRGAVTVALVALFGVTAVGVGGTSLMELAFGLRDGVGANLSAGLVAGGAALAATVWGLRRVRARALS
jgi:hypothetical protein